MLHQLKAMTMGEPNDALLKELHKEGTLLPEVLTRLAALHIGSTEKNEPLRGTLAYAGEQYFPHPLDVPALLLFFFERLGGLWEESKSPVDDLYIATFAMYGVLAIHPFENGNGRTAQDFMQYLLLSRWRLREPPLKFPKDAHQQLGKAFVNLMEPCDGKTPESFYKLRHAIASSMADASLDKLKQIKNFALVADYLQKIVHIDGD